MKFFFDNCTSPVLATTIHDFVQNFGHSAHHIADLPCGRHAPDSEWMAMLSSDANSWVIITGDDRIRRNRAERMAFRSAELRGFVLKPAYQKTPMHQCASFLLWRWKEVEQLMQLVGGAALYELPMSRTSKLRQLPL